MKNVQIKKHIDFTNLKAKVVEVESVENLHYEGVLTKNELLGFSELDIELGSCCHTAALATMCGNGIECVHGLSEYIIVPFHCINRKKDRNGKWRYFDLIAWKFGYCWESFTACRAFDRKQVWDCFAYYGNSFDTSRMCLGNFFYNDNGDLVVVNNRKPTIWSF